jgi:hypothetical protein
MWSVRNAYRAEMRSHERRSSKSLLAKGIILGLVAVAPDVAGPIGARVVVGRDSRCTRGTLPEAAKRVLTAVPETVFVHVRDAAGGLVDRLALPHTLGEGQTGHRAHCVMACQSES